MRCKIALITIGLGFASISGMGLPGLRSTARAQKPDEQNQEQQNQARQNDDRAQFAGMQRVGGEVTALAGRTVTVKAEDGVTYQIVTTDNTRLMKGRGVSLKLADLKVGDGVMAAGNLDAPNNTLHAAVLFAVDGAQIREQRANLGKTFIVGKVTAIDLDNARMTIARPDNVAQTIGFDESSSFRRGGRDRHGAGAEASPAAGTAAATDGAVADLGESITLADIKVGDRVRGTGALKNGIFVPTQLVVVPPGQGRPAGGGHGFGPHSVGPADPAPAAAGPS